MVIYWITVVPLEEELKEADPRLISSFYADYAAFYGSVIRSAQLLKLPI